MVRYLADVNYNHERYVNNNMDIHVYVRHSSIGIYNVYNYVYMYIYVYALEVNIISV